VPHWVVQHFSRWPQRCKLYHLSSWHNHPLRQQQSSISLRRLSLRSLRSDLSVQLPRKCLKCHNAGFGRPFSFSKTNRSNPIRVDKWPASIPYKRHLWKRSVSQHCPVQCLFDSPENKRGIDQSVAATIFEPGHCKQSTGHCVSSFRRKQRCCRSIQQGIRKSIVNCEFISISSDANGSFVETASNSFLIFRHSRHLLKCRRSHDRWRRRLVHSEWRHRHHDHRRWLCSFNQRCCNTRPSCCTSMGHKI
jgi:hypothetical protein